MPTPFSVNRRITTNSHTVATDAARSADALGKNGAPSLRAPRTDPARTDATRAHPLRGSPAAPPANSEQQAVMRPMGEAYKSPASASAYSLAIERQAVIRALAPIYHMPGAIGRAGNAHGKGSGRIRSTDNGHAYSKGGPSHMSKMGKGAVGLVVGALLEAGLSKLSEALLQKLKDPARSLPSYVTPDEIYGAAKALNRAGLSYESCRTMLNTESKRGQFMVGAAALGELEHQRQISPATLKQSLVTLWTNLAQGRDPVQGIEGHDARALVIPDTTKAMSGVGAINESAILAAVDKAGLAPPPARADTNTASSASHTAHQSHTRRPVPNVSALPTVKTKPVARVAPLPTMTRPRKMLPKSTSPAVSTPGQQLSPDRRKSLDQYIQQIGDEHVRRAMDQYDRLRSNGMSESEARARVQAMTSAGAQSNALGAAINQYEALRGRIVMPGRGGNVAVTSKSADKASKTTSNQKLLPGGHEAIRLPDGHKVFIYQWGEHSSWPSTVKDAAAKAGFTENDGPLVFVPEVRDPSGRRPQNESTPELRTWASVVGTKLFDPQMMAMISESPTLLKLLQLALSENLVVTTEGGGTAHYRLDKHLINFGQDANSSPAELLDFMAHELSHATDDSIGKESIESVEKYLQDCYKQEASAMLNQIKVYLELRKVYDQKVRSGDTGAVPPALPHHEISPGTVSIVARGILDKLGDLLFNSPDNAAKFARSIRDRYAKNGNEERALKDLTRFAADPANSWTKDYSTHYLTTYFKTGPRSIDSLKDALKAQPAHSVYWAKEWIRQANNYQLDEFIELLKQAPELKKSLESKGITFDLDNRFGVLLKQNLTETNNYDAQEKLFMDCAKKVTTNLGKERLLKVAEESGIWTAQEMLQVRQWIQDSGHQF
jgi:hypothetical protein